jgi:hypothetical protein
MHVSQVPSIYINGRAINIHKWKSFVSQVPCLASQIPFMYGDDSSPNSLGSQGVRMQAAARSRRTHAHAHSPFRRHRAAAAEAGCGS